MRQQAKEVAKEVYYTAHLVVSSEEEARMELEDSSESSSGTQPAHPPSTGQINNSTVNRLVSLSSSVLSSTQLKFIGKSYVESFKARLQHAFNVSSIAQLLGFVFFQHSSFHPNFLLFSLPKVHPIVRTFLNQTSSPPFSFSFLFPSPNFIS